MPPGKHMPASDEDGGIATTSLRRCEPPSHSTHLTSHACDVCRGTFVARLNASRRKCRIDAWPDRRLAWNSASLPLRIDLGSGVHMRETRSVVPTFWQRLCAVVTTAALVSAGCH